MESLSKNQEEAIRYMQLVFDIEVSDGTFLTKENALGWLEKYNWNLPLAADALRKRAMAYGHVHR